MLPLGKSLQMYIVLSKICSFMAQAHKQEIYIKTILGTNYNTQAICSCAVMCKEIDNFSIFGEEILPIMTGHSKLTLKTSC